MSAPGLIGVHHTRMISDIRWASVDTVFGAGAMDGGQLTTRAPRAFPTRHVEIAQIAAFPFSSMSGGVIVRIRRSPAFQGIWRPKLLNVALEALIKLGR